MEFWTHGGADRASGRGPGRPAPARTNRRLSGTAGRGKTTFTRGLARGWHSRTGDQPDLYLVNESTCGQSPCSTLICTG